MTKWFNSSLVDYANCSSDNETDLLWLNLSTTSEAVVILHASFISLVIIASALGNSLVLLLVLKDRRLRHRSILASLNVTVVDFLLAVFYHGVILSNTLLRRWSYGRDNVDVCNTYGLLSTYIIYVRWIALAFMATDRFLSVKFPFKYRTYSYVFLLLGTFAVWLIPSVLVGIVAPLQSPSFRSNIPTCIPTCNNVDHPIPCRLLVITTFTTVLVLGGVLPSALYTWMYFKAKKLKTTYSLGKAGSPSTIDNITSQMNSFFRERRAMLTVFLIFLTVLLTSLPSYLLLLIRQINLCIFFKIPIVVHFIITDIFLLSTALDPVILMRTSDFRNALKELVLKRPKCRQTSVHSSQTDATISRKQSIDTTYI